MTKEQKEKLVARKTAKAIDYKRVFGTEQGKRVLFDMMKAGHMLDSTMSRGATSHDLAFREGERNFVLRVMTILKTDPEKLKQQIEEGEQDEQGGW